MVIFGNWRVFVSLDDNGKTTAGCQQPGNSFWNKTGSAFDSWLLPKKKYIKK